MATFKQIADKYPELKEDIEKLDNYIDSLPLLEQLKALEQLNVSLREKILETQEAIDLGNEEYDEPIEEIDIFNQDGDDPESLPSISEREDGYI